MAPLQRIRTRLLAIALLASLALPTAAAQQDSFDDVLSVHDDPDGPETVDVADCTFFVRGTGVEIAEGTVDVYEDQGRNGVAFILSVPFEGTPNEDGGFDFLVEVTMEAADELYLEVVLEGERGEFSDPERYVWEVVTVHCGEFYVPCIEGIEAQAGDGGAVTLSWDAEPNATRGYLVVRYDGSQLPNGQPDSETLGETTGTSFVDETAEPGVTYYYEIVGMSELVWTNNDCPGVVVTAVPFFGAPLLAGVGVVGGVAGYAWLRRR